MHLFRKSNVAGYSQSRGGRPVFVKPHVTRAQRKNPDQPDMFRPPAPAPTLKIGEDQARRPEHHTPDLFTGRTRAEDEAPIRAKLAELLHKLPSMHYEAARQAQLALTKEAEGVHKDLADEVFAATQKHMTPRAASMVKLQAAGHDPKHFAAYTGSQPMTKAVVFFKAVTRGDDRTPDLFAPGKTPEVKTRKDGVTQRYHVSTKAGDIVDVHGLPIRIENPRGSIRSKTPRGGGPKWERKMEHHYGDIVGTKGHDGDAVDAYVGPHPESDHVSIVNQHDQAGAFNEHKVMLGFDNHDAAMDGYHAHYPPGWNGAKSSAQMKVPELKHWLQHADKSKPAVATPKDVPGIDEANFAHKRYHLMGRQQFLDRMREHEAESEAALEPNPRKKKGAANRSRATFHHREPIWRSRHKRAVEAALATGNRVHPQVMEDYPDLESTYGKSRSPASEGQADPARPGWNNNVARHIAQVGRIDEAEAHKILQGQPKLADHHYSEKTEPRIAAKHILSEHRDPSHVKGPLITVPDPDKVSEGAKKPKKVKPPGHDAMTMKLAEEMGRQAHLSMKERDPTTNAKYMELVAQATAHRPRATQHFHTAYMVGWRKQEERALDFIGTRKSPA